MLAPAMAMLINAAEMCVEEAIDGFLLTHPDCVRLAGTKVVVRRAAARGDRVALISGGGSGHEPAHCGFVGDGLLSAAVCGDVFASPPASAVLAAIRAVCGAAGALLIVKARQQRTSLRLLLRVPMTLHPIGAGPRTPRPRR